MPRQVIERDKLGVLTKIGQGGQAWFIKHRTSRPSSRHRWSTRNTNRTLAEIDFCASRPCPAVVEDSLCNAQLEPS
jgi:hypothetical protein